jgi:uncharacterized glyoxalase superfamily protein PhnB
MRPNRSIPASTVVPVLVYPDVRAAVAWLGEAFGFAVADVGGARVVDPLTDHVYGGRQYTAVDPWGHRWTFSETLDDVAPADWGGIAVTG